ncbi:APC membrane recruitment protein 3, partial [Frankliniella fusca]
MLAMLLLEEHGHVKTRGVTPLLPPPSPRWTPPGQGDRKIVERSQRLCGPGPGSDFGSVLQRHWAQVTSGSSGRVGSGRAGPDTDCPEPVQLGGDPPPPSLPVPCMLGGGPAAPTRAPRRSPYPADDGMVQSPDGLGRRPVTRSQASRRRPAGASPGPHAAQHRASSQQDVVKALVDSLDDATLAELPGLPGAPAGRRRSQRRGVAGEDCILDGSATLGHPWRGGHAARAKHRVASDGNVSLDGGDHLYSSRFSHRTFPKEMTDVAWYLGDELGALWHQQAPLPGPGPGPGLALTPAHHDPYYRNRSAGASPHYLYHDDLQGCQGQGLSSADNLVNGGDRCWLIGYPRHCASEVSVVSWDRRHPAPASPGNGVVAGGGGGAPGCSGRAANSRPASRAGASPWENLELADGEDSDMHDDLHAHRGKRGGRAACPYQCRCPCDHRELRDQPVPAPATATAPASAQPLAQPLRMSPPSFTHLSRT